MLLSYSRPDLQSQSASIWPAGETQRITIKQIGKLYAMDSIPTDYRSILPEYYRISAFFHFHCTNGMIKCWSQVEMNSMDCWKKCCTGYTACYIWWEALGTNKQSHFSVVCTAGMILSVCCMLEDCVEIIHRALFICLITINHAVHLHCMSYQIK